MSPRLLRWAMNVWPPYLGAGIHVRSISADWSEAVVELRARLLNRNYGTHFGGSVFAMTDPLYALLLIHRLGSRYHVWGHSSNICQSSGQRIRARGGELVARVSKTIYVRLKPAYRPSTGTPDAR